MKCGVYGCRFYAGFVEFRFADICQASVGACQAACKTPVPKLT